MSIGKKLSAQAEVRLKWIDFYHAKRDVSLVSRHFGISRKTFYKWYRRYKILGIVGLEDMSKTPHNKRKAEITLEEELRVKKLRQQYIRYGKEKLAVLYKKIYGETISTWKIYRVIRKYGLYWCSVKNEKLRRKRKLAEKKKRVTELNNRQIDTLLFQLDTKVIWCYSAKRYIFTAVEKNTKIAFARMYKSNSSYSGRDFLLRMYFVLDKNIPYLQSDNGAEFHKHFEDACKQLKIEHYFSRPRTPKDHAEVERFNRTMEEEFLQKGNYIDELEVFNPLLTQWLVEYNFNRPHQSLGYLTPMEFLAQKQINKVLPMYPTHTPF